MACIKRDKRDDIFSKCVRYRTNWTCEGCGREFPDSSTRTDLHCSHLFGRRAKSTRWHPDNAFSHCRDCHRFYEANPLVFEKWAEEKLGTEAYDRVMRLSHTPQKYYSEDLAAIYKHFKAEFRRMELLRMDGIIGRIEFQEFIL